MFPVVDVDDPAGLYDIFPRGYFLQDQVAPRPMYGVPREIDFRTEDGRYAVYEEGLRGKTDVRERATHNRRHARREENKVRLLTKQHLIHREKKWIGAFMSPGAWSTTLAGVASGPAAGEFVQIDQANVDLVKFFDEEKEKVAERTGVMPNTLLMGRAILRAARINALLREQIKYTSAANVELGSLAQLLGFNRVLSPISIYNAAVGEVWDTTRERYVPREDYRFMFNKKEMLMLYVDPDAALQDSMTAGIQVAWTGLLGDGAFNTSVIRGTWDYGEWFDVLQATEPQVVAPDLGTYYTDVVA